MTAGWGYWCCSSACRSFLRAKLQIEHTVNSQRCSHCIGTSPDTHHLELLQILLSACLSVSVSVWRSVYVCLSISHSLYFSVSFCQFLSLSDSLWVCLSLCVSHCLSQSVCDPYNQQGFGQWCMFSLRFLQIYFLNSNCCFHFHHIMYSCCIMLCLNVCFLSFCPSVLFVESDRLIDVVVKASASRADGPGFESRLCRNFSGVESYQWLKNWHSSGYPARHLAL